MTPSSHPQTKSTQTQPIRPAGLYIKGNDPQQPLAFPLKHTDVKAQVAGHISRVEVRQIFENPFTTPLEATYIFPLPDEAAVDSMDIRLGDRTLQGRIEKRETAQDLYDEAKRQGKTAGLLEQERANIFTQSLANMLPGEQIEVVIRYSDILTYQQGSYEFVFPMVVGPRYIPGNPIEGDGSHGSAAGPMQPNRDTDLVPDASRLNAPVLPEGVRSGHDIQVTVNFSAGASAAGSSATGAISNIESPSHKIVVTPQPHGADNGAHHGAQVTLFPSDTLPNKDLILRYQIAGDSTQTNLLSQADDRGGHFALYLIPALSYDREQYLPKEMIFLIDTSGSQFGAPLEQCQALMRRFIEGLHPQDTFNIVDFANTTEQLSTLPLDNTPTHRQKALQYVDRLRAGGGTEMLRGLKTVLNLPQLDPERIRNIVLLTDGYIGNETQIFAAVKRAIPPSSRIHSFGAGSSVNRFLLNRIAEFGRGISQVVRHDEPITTVVDQFFRQINTPVLGNLSLQWEGPGEAPSFYPTTLPDLFAEQPLVIKGRKTDAQAGRLRVHGLMSEGQRFEQCFAVSFEGSFDSGGEADAQQEYASSPGNPAIATQASEGIAQLWGRARIKDLMNQMVSSETVQGVDAVTETALAYQLLCQYTAFVAVSDEMRVEHPDQSVSVDTPVMMPEAISPAGVYGTAQAIRAARPRPVPHSVRAAMSPPAPAMELARGIITPGSASPRPKVPSPSKSALPQPKKVSPPQKSSRAIPNYPNGGDDESRNTMRYSRRMDFFGSPPRSGETRTVNISNLEPQSGWNEATEGFIEQQSQLRDELNLYLATIVLGQGAEQTLVFEVIVKQGRIVRALFDAENSQTLTGETMDRRVTETDAATLRQALLAWKGSAELNLKVQLRLSCTWQ